MSNEKNPYYEQAQKEQWRGDYAVALQYYQRAIQMEPKRGEIYWEMALSMIHMGMKAEAKAAQEKAAQLDPRIRAMVEEKQAKPRKLEEIQELRGQGPRSLPALLAFIKGKDLDVSKAAKEVLRDPNYKVDASCVDPLIKALGSSDEFVMAHYAEAFVRIGAAAVDPLLSLLTHKNKDVVATALQALGQIGDVRSVPSLLEYMKDARYDVSSAAIRALKMMKPREALEPVMDLIRKGDVEEPTDATELLGELGDPRAYDLLVELLQHKSIPTQGSAIYALGQMGDPRAMEHLRPFLKNSWAVLRAKAARALGQLGDTASVDPLGELADKDAEKDVRQAAGEALLVLKQKKSRSV